MKILLIAAVLGLGISGLAAQTANSGGSHQLSNVPSQAGDLRVNTPTANERISQTFIHVTYQLLNRGVSAAVSPNFTVQLDGNDPVNTTANDYTFTGLTPGAHTVTVTLVDANGSPIANSSVATKFTVVDGNRTGRSPSSSYFPASNLQLAGGEIASLPDGATPLPMLSLVGFAVLVGGICTAIRSR
jgi:hypothetical protein